MWRSGYFSAVGTSHIRGNVPCQDSAVVDTSDDGSWFAATLCDGAGSAKYAAEGSRYVSSHFNSRLLELAARLRSEPPGGWVNDAVIRSVLEVRDGLRLLAKGDDLSDYHTTLVAVLLGPNGGLSIHIGDGVVFAGEATLNKLSKNWGINAYSVSAPENGEYANETFFITESVWLKHLRVLPLPKVNWAVLATDGGAEFLFDNDRKSLSSAALTRLFVDGGPQGGDSTGLVTHFLEDSVENYLSDTAYIGLTSDDKTLAVVIRCDVHTESLSIALSTPDLKSQAPWQVHSNPIFIEPQTLQQINRRSRCMACAMMVLGKVMRIIKRGWRWVLLSTAIVVLGVVGYWAYRDDIFGINRFINLTPSERQKGDASTHSIIDLDLRATISQSFSLRLSVKGNG